MPIWPFKRALKNSSFDFSISNSSSWKIISCVSPNLNQGVLTSSARSQHEKLYFFSLVFNLISLLCVLPGDADWAMNKKHHFQNSVCSDHPPNTQVLPCSWVLLLSSRNAVRVPGAGQLPEHLCRCEAQSTISTDVAFPSLEHLQL